MTVGARDARFKLNKVGVRPDSEKGVDDRGWSSAGGEPTLVPSDMGVMKFGLVERAPCFSSVAAKCRFSCSPTKSPVLAVLRFPLPSG